MKWKAERELKDQEYERLQKAHTRLLTLQFEEKQHMMREHQEIIKALQTQFQEYRKTAEVLFKAEASKLEGQLHLQMEEYEEELKYVIAMKDQAFDDMIACKDADAMVTGNIRHYAASIEKLKHVCDARKGEPIFGMDASNISMGRLLSYLFEVTERFGMETRTELILLQRTMVVVEGVARSLNPQINIWEVARPIVEGYIKSNLGPAAVLNDLTTTLKVLARFGPRLPSLVEQALIKQSNPEPQIVKRSWNGSLKPFGLGFIFACLAILILLLCIPINFN